ncbi:MAG: sugar phosphate nucleotidyltransferase, partial [Anaerolineales bacterium]
HLMQAFFQGGQRIGLKISYSYEEFPLGTAGPLSLIEGLDETFMVANGDVLTTLDLRDMIAAHQQNEAVATIATHTRRVKIDLGVIQYDGDDRIAHYIEKPIYDYNVSMGIYLFEPKVLEYIPCNQYLDFPDLVLRLIEAGERVKGYSYDGYWQDLGREDDYEQAVQDFESLREQILGD